MGLHDRDYYWEHRDEQDGKPKKQRYNSKERYSEHSKTQTQDSTHGQPKGTVYSGWAGPVKPANARKPNFSEGSHFFNKGKTQASQEKSRINEQKTTKKNANPGANNLFFFLLVPIVFGLGFGILLKVVKSFF